MNNKSCIQIKSIRLKHQNQYTCPTFVYNIDLGVIKVFWGLKSCKSFNNNLGQVLNFILQMVKYFLIRNNLCWIFKLEGF
jgi:hypothetical protein